MSTYTRLFTDYGLEKQAGRLYDETEFHVANISIGDANGSMYEPQISQTSLVNQRDILSITETVANGNIYQFFAKIPSNIDSYTIREVGLLDEDGRLLWVSQFNMQTVPDIDNLVTENIIGVQIEVSQGTVVTTVDNNVQMATKDYVLSNFQLLNQKGQVEGYCPLDENAIVPFSNLPPSYLCASCSSGNYNNSSGYPDLISYSGANCSFKVSDIYGSYQPLKVVFADGEFKIFNSIADLNVSSLANGVYNLYIDKSGVIHPLKTNDYSSRIAPGGGTTSISYVTHTTTSSTTSYQLSSNLNVNGSPSITSTGVMTNISSSNYLSSTNKPNTFMSSTNWEVQVSFMLTALTSSNPRKVFGNQFVEGSSYAGVNINITTSGKLGVIVKRGSSSTLYDDYQLSVNQKYVVKVSFNGSAYKVYIGTSTSNLTLVHTENSSTATTWGSAGYLYFGKYYSTVNGHVFVNGTIYLQECYVKSNGSYVINNTKTTTTTSTYQEKVVSTTGSTLSTGDIWLDTSLKPYVMRKYDGSSSWDIVDYVRLPQQISVSSGAINAVYTVRSYNSNGWDEQLSSPDLNRQTTLTKGSAFTASYPGWVYNYSVGDTYYLDKGSTYTPSSSSAGTWYYSPIKGS